MTLTASPETDLAVARACGFRNARFIETAAGARCFRDTPDDDTKCVPPVEKRFSPSTDLNDAFLAAEKVGLFGDASMSLQHWHCGWTMVDEFCDGINSERMIQATSTPSLAICAAILNLSETES